MQLVADSQGGVIGRASFGPTSLSAQTWEQMTEEDKNREATGLDWCHPVLLDYILGDSKPA